MDKKKIDWSEFLLGCLLIGLSLSVTALLVVIPLYYFEIVSKQTARMIIIVPTAIPFAIMAIAAPIAIGRLAIETIKGAFNENDQ